MYLKKIYRFTRSMEIEKVFSGRYGKRCRRGRNRNPTPADVERVNIRNAVKRLRRLIKANFTPDDWSITLTYRRDGRPDRREAARILSNWKKRMKRAYAKEGVTFKWIEVTEYMSKSIHHHLIVNECNGKATKLIKEKWNCGHVHFSPIWANDEVDGLAEYFIKETKRSSKEPDAIRRTKYSHSRNLVIPIPKVEIIMAKEWRQEPKAPKGWYLDKNSIYEGVSEITGHRYQYYTMIKIEKKRE